MSAQKSKVDPYLLLLGISPTEERTHYRLLDVPVFEPNMNVIESGRNRRNASLRQIKDGDLLADAERIKEEIAKAFRCLCNPESKKRYDTELQEHLNRREAEKVSLQLKPDLAFGDDVREHQVQQFRTAVREAFADGIVEQREKEHLQQLHLKLGVSAEEARGIFAEIAKETQAGVQRELERRRIETELKAKRQNEARDLRATIFKPTAKVPPSVPHQLTTPSVPKTPQPISPQRSLPQHPPELNPFANLTLDIPSVHAKSFAKSQVLIPACGIGVCSALWILMSGIAIVANTEKELNNFFYIIIFLVNVCIFLGAMSMHRLGSLTWARCACALSLVMHFSCLCLGPILGTWGLIVMARRDVKAAFRR